MVSLLPSPSASSTRRRRTAPEDSPGSARLPLQRMLPTQASTQRPRSRLPTAWPCWTWSLFPQSPTHWVPSSLGTLAFALPSILPAPLRPRSLLLKPSPEASSSPGFAQTSLRGPQALLAPQASSCLCPQPELLGDRRILTILSHSPDRPWQGKEKATPPHPTLGWGPCGLFWGK